MPFKDIIFAVAKKLGVKIQCSAIASPGKGNRPTVRFPHTIKYAAI